MFLICQKCSIKYPRDKIQPTPTVRSSKSQFRKELDLSKYREKGIKRFREMSPVLREPLQAQTPQLGLSEFISGFMSLCFAKFTPLNGFVYIWQMGSNIWLVLIYLSLLSPSQANWNTTRTSSSDLLIYWNEFNCLRI